jgi:hypothetical protein
MDPDAVRSDGILYTAGSPFFQLGEIRIFASGPQTASHPTPAAGTGGHLQRTEASVILMERMQHDDK